MIVRLSAEADADVRRLILQGLEQFGEQQVADYLDGLENAFRSLAEYPLLGTERPEFGKPYRTYVYKSHIVFYRVEADAILVTRICHGREDWLDD